VAADIRQMISSIAGIEPFPGLEEAWKWSPTPRFTFALALSSNSRSAFQVNSLGSFDVDLTRRVLEFSRANELQSTVESNPLAITGGFMCEPFAFNAVATACPEVHGYHIGRNELLNELVVAAFPAFLSEVSGCEPLEEAKYRFKQMLHPTVMNRSPVPYLRMRYENPKTGAGSIGDLRGFTTWDVLLRELNLLEGVAGSFVECENVHGDVCRIEWHGHWVVQGENPTQELEQSELKNWMAVFLGSALDG
jgi:hypothetical protein